MLDECGLGSLNGDRGEYLEGGKSIPGAFVLLDKKDVRKGRSQLESGLSLLADIREKYINVYDSLAHAED